jgi:hypothetical protein
MSSSANLAAWLTCVPVEQQLAGIFEIAVVRGRAALEMIAEMLKNSQHIDEVEAPDWLKGWAAKLTPNEVRAIETGRDREKAALRADIETLFDDDPTKWTDAERAHAEVVKWRLSAVNLVLSCRGEQAASAA